MPLCFCNKYCNNTLLLQYLLQPLQHQIIQTDMEQLDLRQAKRYLPHGGMNVVAERAKVLRCDASKMFNGWETPATERVRKETREYLTEVHTGLTQLLQQS